MSRPTPTEPTSSVRRRTRALLLASALLASPLWSCGDGDEARRQARRGALRDLLGQDVDPGEAVARVNGRPIGAEAFANIVARSDDGRSTRQILDDLINAQLLYDEAIAEGYGDSPEVRLELKRSMVQRMLSEEIEARHLPEEIDADRVESYYEDNRHHYFRPHLRSAIHLLVLPERDTYPPGPDVPESILARTEGVAASIRRDMEARGMTKGPTQEDLETLAEAWRPRLPEGLEIHVEGGITAPRRQVGEPGKPGFYPALVDPFADALFEAEVDRPTEPVRTQFGTHIIVLKKDHPEDLVTLQEATPGIREFLAEGDRRKAMRALVDRVMSRTEARVDPDSAASLQETNGASDEPEPGGEAP